MIGKITIDQAGRLVLPKPIREALRIRPGDSLQVETEDDRIVLSPVRSSAGLHKELGVWIYRSGTPAHASISELIDEQRRRRTEALISNQS